MIVGIDGGKPPKTVWAWKGPSVRGWLRSPPGQPFSLAVVEKPAGVIRKGRTPASVISPAFWGGAAVFSVQAERRIAVSPEQWKRKLLGAAWNMEKRAACRNFVDFFNLEGLDPEDDGDQDVIDAIAISEAGALFTEKEIKKCLIKW